jgi:hypothetical protein
MSKENAEWWPEPNLPWYSLGVRQDSGNYPRPECGKLRICECVYAAIAVTLKAPLRQRDDASGFLPILRCRREAFDPQAH